jgi:hypothetical protein
LGNTVAYQPSRITAGLLGIHQVHIQIARFFKGFRDSILGDLVENNPFCFGRVDLSDSIRCQAIASPSRSGVGCQENFLGSICQAFIF